MFNHEKMRRDAALFASLQQEGKTIDEIFSIINITPVIPKGLQYKMIKVISGLQTGIDEYGLEIAHELGFPTGGTTTYDYGQEGGLNSQEKAIKYGVVAISKEAQAKFEKKNSYMSKASCYYNARTELNAKNADITLYFATDLDSAGLISTKRYAEYHDKPFKQLNVDFVTPNQLFNLIDLKEHKVINIARNRASKLSQEDITYFKQFITEFLTLLK